MTDDTIQQPTDSAVPTKPGWYLDREGDAWHLPGPGDANQTPGAFEFGDPEDFEFAPFVRLIPETELAHTDSIKILLQRAVDALKRQDRGELEFLITVCDTPEVLGGNA